jgi:uncharacterized membrane protein
MEYTTYSEYRRVARENLAGNWKVSVATAFVASLFGALMAGTQSRLDIDAEIMARLPAVLVTYFKVLTTIGLILAIPSIIIGGAVQIGYAQYLLKQYNKANFEFRDLFSQFDRIWQGFLQSFLRSLYVILWSLLFLIPGIIKSYAYAMTPFIMAENPDMAASEAIAASAELMKGHKLDLFFLSLTFLGWTLLNLLTLGIGSLFLNPYINAAHAAFYKDITRTNREYE